jgi:hypothetical protein
MLVETDDLSFTQQRTQATLTSGTDNLMALAKDLTETATHVREWYDHSKAALLMERAALVIERYAPLDPDIDAEQGEN